MAEPRYLRRAPITEAVIDLRVEPTTGSSVDALVGALGQRGNLGYVPKGFLIHSEFGFSLKVEAADPKVMPHEGHATTTGVRLHSPDEKYVAQLGVGGFALSRLEPYESWENLVTEAQRLWRGYLECLGLGVVTRTATRYINNLGLPFTPQLADFLTLVPTLPQGLPENLSSFLQRYVLQDVATQANVIVTEALAEALPGKPVPVILDIDVFRQTRLDVNDANVWTYLEQLRGLKNRIFFSCLTETGVALYR
jgi:uncharacterized protein (TIGR04255 family)